MTAHLLNICRDFYYFALRESEDTVTEGPVILGENPIGKVC